MKNILKHLFPFILIGIFLTYGAYAASILQVFQGGTGIATTTKGDLLYSNATDTLAKLGIGTNSYILTASSGLPVWKANSAGTTYSATGTLLNLSGTNFSVNAGTLTDTKYCIYTAGVGLVCNSEGGSGVTSVAMTVPTGLSIAGSPITATGTLALSLTSGYVIPLSASTTNWNTAYGWGDWNGNIDISTDTNLATSTGISLTGDTLGLILSGIDHDQLLNFVQGEHFLQSAITEVGTISTGTWSGTSILNSKIASSTDYLSDTKWTGVSTDLVAATGRTSLGLGSMALLSDTGSTSITTLGTISTGVWSGTSILNAKIASSTDYLADTNTTYAATGTLLNLTGTNFKVNEGTLTNTKLCLYTSGTGIVCNTTDGSTNWNTAYDDRLKWDGGNTGLVAATGRTSLELGTMSLEANTGSTTITTLGTIATGVWSGTSILDAKIASSTDYLADIYWTGTATNLVAATGRTSLGLGAMALNPATGSTTITTLGTIGTGTWNADSILNAKIASSTEYLSDVNWNGGTTGLATATARISLSLVPGTNVQAYDAGLNSIAGLITNGDMMIYTTALDTYATTSLTTAGRALLDDAAASNQRTTLGLGTMSLEANSGSTTITTLGTIGTGTWNATAISTTKGGTGQDWSNIATGSIPYFNGTGALSTLAGATDTWVLTAKGVGVAPAWVASAAGGDITSIGDCTNGACFDGTQGTFLTYYNAGGNASSSYNGTLFNFNKPLTASGTITSSGVFDATGAVAMTIGSADITSLTFTTDGTGNAEFTFPADVIGDADIDWGAGAGQVDLADILGGVSGASVWDFGGATSLELPNSTAVTVDARGEIGIDLTSDYLYYYGSSTAKVIAPFYEKCFTDISATTTHDNLQVFAPYKAITVFEAYCRVSTTTVQITLSDGTNAMPTITCDTAGIATSTVSNNTFTANEKVEFDTGTMGTAYTAGTDWVNVCLRFTYTAD